MFSTIEVGKKISSFRKEKNMTQMELADSLGVSYQAVSNWERGNSMPDISKLPELVSILGCSIDELLGNRRESQLFQKVIEGDGEAYVKENRITASEVASAAPILKPSQTESLMEAVLEENKEKITLEDLAKIAPFVSDDFLMQWIEQIDVIENIKGITSLAPFLSTDSLDTLISKIMKIGDLSDVTPLAPFLSKKTIRYLVDKALEGGTIGDCVGLYPFLDKESARKLADRLMKESNLKEFVKLAPFL